MELLSLFSGAGGLDLGFRRAGFDVVAGCEFDRHFWATFERNHEAVLFKGDVCGFSSSVFPDVGGVIGGPPCQSWSVGGAGRGLDDERGRLFFEYVRVLKDKRPLFFVAENVKGILSKRHEVALSRILGELEDAGYDVSVCLLNAGDFGLGQDRERVFFVGFRRDLGAVFVPPAVHDVGVCLRDVIGDLGDCVVPAAPGNRSRGDSCLVDNHEFFTGGFSPLFLSANRVRSWDKRAFTVQASGRQCQLHPSAPAMERVSRGVFRFVDGFDYRRLSVRECARLQGFPDDFSFVYDRVDVGYRMVGNAVPVGLAFDVACAVKRALVSAGVVV